MNLPIYVVVQARLGSSRLPGKALCPFGEYSMFELVLRRAGRSKLISGIIAALPDSRNDDALAEIALQCGAEVVRGDSEDVLSRFVSVVQGRTPCHIVRVCADNPLIAPEAIDALCGMMKSGAYDLVENTSRASNYPDGVGAEILTSECLARLDRETTEPTLREHVTALAYRKPELFKIGRNYAPDQWKAPHLRLDVDYREDYFAMEKFIALLGSDPVVVTIEQIVESALTKSVIFEKRRQRDGSGLQAPAQS